VYTALAMGQLLLDLALARRIEMAEAQAAVRCVETFKRLIPGHEATAE